MSIKKYLVLRRKYDTFKIITLFFIFAIIFLIFGIKTIYELYNMVNAPVEYVTYGDVTKSKLKEINELKNVVDAGFDITYSENIRFKTINTSITYHELSEKYIENAYGIKSSGNMKIFYMNKPAYDRLLKEINSDRSLINNVMSIDELDIIDNFGGLVGKAKVFVVDIKCHEKDEYIIAGVKNHNYIFDTTSYIEKNTYENLGIRSMFEKGDMSGDNISYIEDKGLSIDNYEEELKKEFNIKLKINSIKYNLCISFFCFFFVVLFFIILKNVEITQLL